MPRSMTGFGRGECLRYDRRFKVEIKSVNHRYGDFSIRLPRFLNAFEERVRKRLAQEIARGKVEVWVGFDSYTQKDISAKLNTAFADAYMEALRDLCARYGWEYALKTPEPGLALLARNSDIISFEKFEAAYSDEAVQNEFWETLAEALAEALARFNAMRETEGAALVRDIREKQKRIRSLAAQIAERAPIAAAENAVRLRERLSELLSMLDTDREIEETRFLTEIAILADKTSIDEELTRLASHLSQLDDILNEAEPIGRKLDFLVQELNREANTIGSKSNDQMLGKLVVEMKSEVEKIREQVQNIE